jgi:zinc protease
MWKADRLFTVTAALLVSWTGLWASAAAPGGGGYAVVVSRATMEDAGWEKVVDSLKNKYRGEVLVYNETLDEALDALQAAFPRFTCFVARPDEATRDYVAKVHQLTRRLDNDIYTDTLWGILTGYDATNALRIARHTEPLTVRKVGSGTEFAMDMVEEGVWYCELVKGKAVRKDAGGQAKEVEVEPDTTKALVDTLNEYRVDLFITSGHATERDWQIGYRYRNGSFRSEAGRLYGIDTRGNRHDIHSNNPKVYLPIGNCLMGHIDGPDAMALAWMNSAGVHQMIGYTVSTWFGYAGWGCLDYFLEQPGRYTFVEAFFANHQALLHKLKTEPSRGLTFDRDTVAFYGDPAWEARMADRPKAWDQKLTETDGVFTFTLTPNRGEKTFQPINTNGSQRGYRPIIEIFPVRLADVEIVRGQELGPVITDNFMLIPNPKTCDPGRNYEVVFKARKIPAS